METDSECVSITQCNQSEGWGLGGGWAGERFKCLLICWCSTSVQIDEAQTKRDKGGNEENMKEAGWKNSVLILLM